MQPGETQQMIVRTWWKRPGARTFWLLAMVLALGWGWRSLAQQRGPHITWTSQPQQLQRGGSFVWKGQIKGASATRLKAGLSVSLSITHQSKEIALGRASVNPDGSFVLRGHIPRDITPHTHQLKASIWGRPTRPKNADQEPRPRPQPTPPKGRNDPKGPKGRTGPDRRTKTGKRTPGKGTTKRGQGTPDKPSSRKPGANDKPGKGNASNGKNTGKDTGKGTADRPAPRRGKSDGPDGTSPGKRSNSDNGGKRDNSDNSDNSDKSDGAGPPKPSPRASRLWKRLRDGWGPGATKDAQRQRQNSEKRRQKNRFVLPPIGALPPVSRPPSRSPRSGQPPTSPPPSTSPRQPGAPGQGTRPDQPPQSGQPPQAGQPPRSGQPSPQRPPSGFNQLPPSAMNRQGRAGQRRRGSDAQRGRSRDRSGNDSQSQRQGTPGQQGRRPSQGWRRQRSRRPGRGPQYDPDFQTGTPGGQSPPPSSNAKGPPIMMPSSRRRGGSQAAPPGAGGDNRLWSQADRSQLDLRTKGGHTYMRQVFEPYLPQHQRITAFDRILRGYRLATSSTRKRRIRVGGRRSRSRSYFVGRIRIVLFPGRWTPIPSVAPDARILWYQTTPRSRLQFAKDNTDIVYVRSYQQRTRHIFLEFGTDADRSYFGGPVPRGIKVSQYSRRVRPRVPARIETTVRRHMHRLGLHSRMDLRQKMDKIIPFLRSFVARPLKPNERRGNPYLTLIQARAGVCRHRAMLFTVTMRSLGYPARFVANNAHAFAEIQYPNGRWRQVDLGGGDLPHYMGSWRGPSFKPPKDPFPKPPPSARTQVPQQGRQQLQHPPPPGTYNPGYSQAPVAPSGRLPQPRKRKKKARDYVSHSRLF